MANEPENHTLALLREIRAVQDKTNARIGEMDARIGDMDARIGDMNARIDTLPTVEQVERAFRIFSEHNDARFQQMEERFDTRFQQMEERVDARFQHMEERFDSVDDALEALRSENTVQHSTEVSNILKIQDHEKRIAQLEKDRGSEADRPITEPH